MMAITTKSSINVNAHRDMVSSFQGFSTKGGKTFSPSVLISTSNPEDSGAK